MTEEMNWTMKTKRRRRSKQTYEDIPICVSCDNCDSQFSSIADLNVHSITCKNLDYSQFKRCPYCTNIFNNHNDFYNHTCDLNDNLPCKYCGMKLHTNLELIKHIREYHNNDQKPYTCSICFQKFPRHSSLSNHLKIHNYQPGRALFVNCNNPKKSTTVSINNINYDQSTSIIKTEFVEEMNGDIDNEVELNDPLSNFAVTNNEDSAENILAENNDTYKIFIKTENTNSDSEAEQETKIENSKEKRENNKAPQETKAVQNYDEKRPYECPTCNLSFSREKALNNHIKLHSINLKSERKSICEYCAESFKTEKQKLKHMAKCTNETSKKPKSILKKTKSIKSPEISNGKLAHSMNSSTSLPSPNTSVNSSMSEFSSSSPIKLPSFEISSTNLNSDYELSGDYRYRCPQCDKKFCTKRRLFQHVWIHKEQFYICEVCAMSFVTKSSLDKHKASQHPTRSRFWCQVCMKSFNSRQSLWEHNQVHVKISGNTFSCAPCKRNFPDKNELAMHEKTHNHHMKSFSCRFCAKIFSDKINLTKHENNHLTKTPFICPVCYQDFTRKASLKYHIRGKHTYILSENNANLPCPICNAIIGNKDELCEHLLGHSDALNQRKQPVSKNVSPPKLIKQESHGSDSSDSEQNYYICPICLCEYEHVEFIRDHIRSKHVAMLPVNNDLIQCPICNEMLRDKDELCEHLVKHSDMLNGHEQKGIKIKEEKIDSAEENNDVENLNSSELNILFTENNRNPFEDEEPNYTIEEKYVPPVNVTDENVIMRCDLCSVKFESHKDLSEHVKMHIF